jgi:hypothetical protein
MGGTLTFRAASRSAKKGSCVVIRTYQAEHGGTVFVQALTERQRRARTRLMALVVIAATAISAATVMGFTHRAASLARSDITTSWAP